MSSRTAVRPRFSARVVVGCCCHRPSNPARGGRSETQLLRAIEISKKKRREEQYRLQLVQQQLMQDRLLRGRLLETAAQKERDFIRLTGVVAAGDYRINTVNVCINP